MTDFVCVSEGVFSMEAECKIIAPPGILAQKTEIGNNGKGQGCGVGGDLEGHRNGDVPPLTPLRVT